MIGCFTTVLTILQIDKTLKQFLKNKHLKRDIGKKLLKQFKIWLLYTRF